MTPQFKKFRDTLDEIFMLDHAELDFGIYRIMNQKREDISAYLDTELEKQVQAELQRHSSSSSDADKQELAQLEATLRQAGMDPDQSPKVQELKAKIGSSADMATLEGEVYSHLATFFKRYYEGGDFMSMRRYKKDVYAIPYEGEEVKLHWANADQYYIKTSEYFQNYTFKTGDGRTVNFRLRDASTEQNNNKTQGDQERKFRLCGSDAITEENGELNVWFTYEPMPKSTKQKALQEEAFKKLKEIIPATWQVELFRPAPTDKDKARTLLEKHINDYVSRNSFDYFIHKDLGAFLRRELDFYVKNEVFFIDDINTVEPERFLSYLSQVKTIKAVGERLITFLAQLEDFQKKLWLKKKFVVECNYCITLDRVPQEFYCEIAASDAQREEWVRLFAIDDIKAGAGDLLSGATAGYSNPLTVEFLKSNPYLVLDTAFFGEEFKSKLLAAISEDGNIDDQLDGTLINSENFQALNLLQEKYTEKVKSVFIDPPYNTEDSEGQNDFTYKDNYKHSSWLSMFGDRMKLCYDLLSNKGLHSTTISDIELLHTLGVYNDVFSEDNRIGIIQWNSTKSVTNTALISMGHTHIPLYAKDKDYYVKHRAEFRLPDSEDGFSNPDNDPRGKWKADPFQVGGERPNQLYEITNPKTGQIYKPNKGSSWKNDYDTYQKLIADNRIVFGVSGEAGPQRKRFWFEAEERGKVAKTWWDEVETTTNGTQQLKNIFGECPFKNPKPVGLMEKIQMLCSAEDSIILDYFGGSGTTGHAVINLNREDGGKRKYILVEMGTYFDSVTKPRIQKVIYSKDWKDGKAVSRIGSSHMFKYMRLEQYEDTLNNLVLASKGLDFSVDSDNFSAGFLLGYMLDTEARGSLFNTAWFENPFDFRLKITRNNELTETRIDLIETFNYLIGLNVSAVQYPKAGLCVIEGTTRRGEKTLIIWRDCQVIDNTALVETLRKLSYNTLDTEFDVIYVNGDNTLQNSRRDEEHWKVTLIEQEFSTRMFEMK